MSSQPHPTTPTPEELARAMLSVPDDASLARIARARQMVSAAVVTLKTIQKLLKSARDSLRAAGGVEITTYVKHPPDRRTALSPEIRDEIDHEGLNEFRPGRWVTTTHGGEDTDLESALHHAIDGALDEELSDSTGLVGAIFKVDEDSLHRDLTNILGMLPDDQLYIIADAGRRNGWLEVGDEG